MPSIANNVTKNALLVAVGTTNVNVIYSAFTKVPVYQNASYSRYRRFSKSQHITIWKINLTGLMKTLVNLNISFDASKISFPCYFVLNLKSHGKNVQWFLKHHSPGSNDDTQIHKVISTTIQLRFITSSEKQDFYLKITYLVSWLPFSIITIIQIGKMFPDPDIKFI